jgi:tetratricopeptide (TPR) repeat protein
LHSLVDDPYYGYGGAALPIVFIPLGLLARSGSMTSSEPVSKRLGFQPAFVMWGSAAVLLVVGFLTPPGRAAVEANLGALAQSYTELSKYGWPEVPIQDALRRLDGADLSSAVAHYQTALAIDPANATANRRLGQIELAREQFDAACEHLAAAYQAMPQQRAAIQLLGECYALNDQPDRAAELWRTLDTSAGQLTLRHWWYETYLGDSENALRLNRADLTLSSRQIAVPPEH